MKGVSFAHAAEADDGGFELLLCHVGKKSSRLLKISSLSLKSALVSCNSLS